jgi:hypothetical protein
MCSVERSSLKKKCVDSSLNCGDFLVLLHGWQKEQEKK